MPDEDVALLDKIVGDLPILADLSRADVLLCCQNLNGGLTVIAQAAPHSVAPIYARGELEGTQLDKGKVRVFSIFARLPTSRVVYTLQIRGGMVARQYYPLRNAKGTVVGVLVKDSYWLAYERQKRRARVFQNALDAFIKMVLRGELVDGDTLSPFGEHDGIVYIDTTRTILYMSGVAAGLYRHIGYRDSIIGHRVNELSPSDQELFNLASNQQRCIERQDEQDGITWIRKALPVLRPKSTWLGQFGLGKPRQNSEIQGIFLLVHDATESVQTQREIESKMSLIREVHHRVKNNLQVIASLMRMQARRVSSIEAKEALEESVNRILSVAVVHEYLSQNANGAINLQEVAHRIVLQMHQGLIDPSRNINFTVSGDAIWLPAERATQCALVINELVQNALEHGLEHRDQGNVAVQLSDLGDQVKITVNDNGEGLPTGFDLESSANLGLRIVRSLVERDLRGHFALDSDNGTQAVVVFEKSIMGG
ncbi:MAG: sensor histidine kinase [Chloroflexi bacterium]|nr:sensor histidine kinase [Chloroflexota bacterium]